MLDRKAEEFWWAMQAVCTTLRRGEVERHAGRHAELILSREEGKPGCAIQADRLHTWRYALGLGEGIKGIQVTACVHGEMASLTVQCRPCTGR